ncbi:MAG: transposase [Spirochaetales bacterium]|nr:transposase [Spirochaetales bacterium]
MVSSLQTFGEYAAWHPHWHTIVLEGGFDRYDRFVFIPIGASEELVELWRARVVEFFAARKLINAALETKGRGPP